MSKRHKLLTAFLMLTVTSGCARGSTEPTVKYVSDGCRWIEPIPYDSTKDSPETVELIQRLNSRFVCVCEGDCPEEEDQ